MTKKFTDITPKNPLKKKANFVWTKNRTKHLNFFWIILIILFVLLNGLVFYSQIKLVLNNAIESARESFTSLKKAKALYEYANFNEALNTFKQIEANITEVTRDTWFLKGSIDFTQKLTDSGILLANSGQLLSEVALNLEKFPAQFFEANRLQKKNNLTQNIQDQIPTLLKVEQNLNQILTNLNSINLSILPANLQQILETEIQNLDSLIKVYSKLIDSYYLALDLLGHQVPHTYLILVQNNNELRPTGGFFGSIIKAEVSKGVLTRFELEDIYKYDGVLFDTSENIPPEFKDFTKELWIRDANFTPDFAVSAKRIEKMLQRAGGQSFDTVIGIDQTLVKQVLSIVGEVRIPNLNAGLNAENYDTVLTYFIEAEKDIRAEDKKILKSFISEFQKKLFSSIELKSLSQILISNLKNQHIQIYSKKPEIQNLFSELNFTGEVPKSLKSNQDYLLVTNSSIGGNKTDKYIKQRLTHTTHIKNNGSIQNTLTIKKYHSFNDSEEYKWQNELAPFGVNQMVDFTRYILGRGDNKSAVKIYVPNGAKIKSASKGYKVTTHFDKELNKTYFLTEQLVKPGKISEFSIVYELDNRLKFKPVANYELVLQNQPGDTNTTFVKQYKYQQNSPRVYRHIPEFEQFDTITNYPSLDFELNRDITLKAILAK